MKKFILTVSILFFCISLCAQWDPNGTNRSTGSLYLGGSRLNIGETTKTATSVYLELKPEIGAYGEILFRYDNSSKKVSIRSTYDERGGNLQFWTFTPTTNMTPWMILTGQGKLGIGTAIPTERLDVNGNIKANNLKISGDIRAKQVRMQGQTMHIGKEGENQLSQLYLHFDQKINSYGEIAFRYYDPETQTINKSWIKSTFLADGSNLEFITHPVNAASTSRMIITPQGKIGIGTKTPTALLDINGDVKANKLDIAGTVRAKQVKIEVNNWADHVFANDYQLPTLTEVEKHINENKYLPGVPSEKEVREKGIDMAEMQALLLQKIEELTLYVIEQQKEINKLKEENIQHQRIEK